VGSHCRSGTASTTQMAYFVIRTLSIEGGSATLRN
jgi:hypothetical protein